MVGLQKTAGNEVLFNTYDKDGNGIIDKKEAIAMQKSLNSLSNGNGKISKREMKTLYGKDNKAAFEALSRLADQQEKATPKGEKYVEVNGNKTTEFYNSNFGPEGSQWQETTKNADGSTTIKYQNGDQLIKHNDGSSEYIQKDGTIIKYDKSGKKVSTTTTDGSEITFPNDNTSIIKNKDGQKIKTIENIKDETITTNYEYKEGQTIAKKYVGDGSDAQLTSITVSSKENGHNIDKIYTDEESFKNNRPSESIQDAHNPTLKTMTKYTYDSQGNIKAETTNSAGETTITYKNQAGEEITAEQFNPSETTTEETFDGGELAGITVTAKRPSEETIAKRKELQNILGENYDVGYAQDGTIEVRDKNGNLLAEATKKANEKSNPNGLTDEIMAAGDENKNDSLDKTEYRNFIINTLGLQVTDANKEKIDNIINSSFASFDSVKKDNTISREELNKNAEEILAQVGNSINAMEEEQLTSQVKNNPDEKINKQNQTDT